MTTCFQRITRGVALVTGCALVSACGGSSGGLFTPDTTESGQRVVSGGQVNVSLRDETNGSVEVPSVGLIAYVTGLSSDRTIVTSYAGIQSGATVGPAETSGTGSYTARYAYTGTHKTFPSSTINSVFGSGERIVTLNADFDNNTLRGTTPDIDVNGRIAGTSLRGNVVVDYNAGLGVSGRVNTTLNGQIGSTGVIGVFTGDTDTNTIAGGFVGTRNP